MERSDNFLGWADIYAVCEEYMRMRGNPVMAYKAAEGYRALQLASQNQDAAQAAELRMEKLEEGEIEQRRQEKTKGNEAFIRELLKGDPPPLGGRRARVIVGSN